MEGTGASEGTVKEPIVLPPRRPSFIAHYSRASKLGAVALTLVGLVALSYVFVKIVSKGEILKTAGHHGSKIYSADHQPEAAVTAEGPSDKAPSNGSASAGGESFNSQDDRSIAMVPAPAPNLTENTQQGDLPRISEDGRQPWHVYARPFNTTDTHPRLAILVAGLGLSRSITDAAISRLPANVTLAFDVQSPVIGAWCGRARQEGHEILLSVPMEPFDFPRSDPGPHTLLTTLPDNTNLEKLNWSLSRGTGYIGITTLSGSRFTTDTGKMKPVIDVLRQRGLMILDAHVAPHSAVTELAHDQHVPVATVNERIDEDLSPEAIDTALQQLVQVARLDGRALVVVPPLPIIIDRLQEWLKTLPQQGITLAPVSAVVH